MIKNLPLKDKKILILGFGREGQDTLKFLKKLFPKKKIGIADQKLDKDYLKTLKDYDVIIKSPGVPFKIIPRSELRKLTTQTEIFFDNCPGQIIGVTGTKGKSTTTSMIYQILKACPERSRRVHLVGNIGQPVLNFLLSATPKDIYAYELSSHQLYNLKKSPHVAVLLNIYPEHLDYYKNFKEYAAAKANIALYQTKKDYFIFNSQQKIVKDIAKKVKAKKIPIKGEYYELDKAAARAVAKIFNISEKIIGKALKNFKYLAHRLELVGTFRGITFYNDALATIPEATMAAMKTLGDRVETIMLGGFDRNIDFGELAEKVLKSKIKTVILFPTTGEKIWREIIEKAKGRGLPNHFYADNMLKAVKLAYQETRTGKICLLSTASSSYSIFKDYKEKGDLFKKYVKTLAKR